MYIMKTQIALDRHTAHDMAFSLLKGTGGFGLLRMQHLITIAEEESLETDEETEMFIALAPFLEAGSSPVCETSRNLYLNAAIYLDRYGYYREGAAIASVDVSHWLNLFAGTPNDQYFRPTARNANVRHALEKLDRKVKDNGALAFSIEDRVQSVSDRFGERSIYVSAWVMSLYSIADEEDVLAATLSTHPRELHSPK